MCEMCVAQGKMTQEELVQEMKDARELVTKILELLDARGEEQVVNVLLSCLINVAADTNISPDSIIVALVKGFNIPIVPISTPNLFGKGEIKH